MYIAYVKVEMVNINHFAVSLPLIVPRITRHVFLCRSRSPHLTFNVFKLRSACC